MATVIEQNAKRGASFDDSLTTTPPAAETLSQERAYLSTLPKQVREHPLLDERSWVNLRESGRDPIDCTELASTIESRAEFLVGAWLIDAIVPPGLGGSLLGNLQPQMLREADILNAGRRRNGVLEPRRSSKTTSLWCVLLGRCYLRPVHMAGFSMLTTAKKTTERFRLDVFGPIARKWPDPKTRPVKLINSNGFERVEFHNGSVLAILSPEGDAIRSGAYDTLVLDEGGEATPEKWQDVIASVLPAFDTRGPGAQLIVAGTGGHYREGSYFWKILHDEKAGRLRYGVRDDIEETALEHWDTVGPLIDAIHPGLDGLTELDIIEENFYGLGWELFAREYLGHFGAAVTATGAIPARTWARTLGPGSLPEGVTPGALAFAVHPGGLWSSIAVAWHLEQGTDLASAAWALDGEAETHEPLIGFKIIHHEAGNDQIASAVYRLSRETKLPIIHGPGVQEKAIAEKINARARPRPRMRMLNGLEVSVAHTGLLNALKHGQATHWKQEPLDAAARVAALNMAGKARYIGIPRENAEADVTPIEAAALAVHTLGAPRERNKIIPIATI